jgi:hypothetical protein
LLSQALKHATFEVSKTNIMKHIKNILIAVFLISFSSTIAQNKAANAETKKKVALFTSAEKDNIQIWFYERVNEMTITEVTREQYYSIILNYSAKMGRLNSPKNAYTKEETKTRFDSYVFKINDEVKLILTEEQYQEHLKNYGEVVRNISNKLAKAKEQRVR